MKVLVDSCVWSLALRRRVAVEDPYVQELRRLIEEYSVEMIGPIRQEILSGIRDPIQLQNLQEYLRSFSDLHLGFEDYELAAKFFSTCRQNGVQGSNTDFLICAVAERREMPILTSDDDFTNYRQHLPIDLFPVGA